MELTRKHRFPFHQGQALSAAQSSCRPEFMQHLRQFPNDTNFVVEPKAGAGFGCVQLRLRVRSSGAADSDLLSCSSRLFRVL